MRSFVHPLLIGFAVGAVVLQWASTLPPYPLAWLAGGIGGCAVALRKFGRARLVGAALFATLAGFGYAGWRAESRLADALATEWEGVDIRIVGVVDDLPQVVDRGVRFAFIVERVVTEGAHVPTHISLGFFAPRTSDDDEAVEIPSVHAGERWSFTVRLKRPHGGVNPAGFDLEAWLIEHNLRATGYVRASANNARLDAFAGRPGAYVQRARESIRSRILAALDTKPFAGVIVALAIGDQRAIPESQWLVFNRTGIAHLVSISGLHVTVFATLAGALAFVLARRSVALTQRIPARKVAAFVGAAFAFAYVLLAGAEVPAVRTLLMLVVAACGLWIGRRGTAAVGWLWALAIVVVWDPWASLAPGFWLSFGAVGLLLYAGCGRLASARSASWRDRIQSTLRDGARTQWVVTIGLVPATLALFQQFSLVSALANAIAIPTVTLAIVPLTLTGIVVPIDVLFVAAHAMLAPLMALLEELARLPSAVWAQHAPLPWTVVVGMLGVLLLVAPRGVAGRWLGAVWLFPLVLVRPERPDEATFRAVALDVGQGLSVVVRTAHHALVYDTGARFGDTIDAGGRIVAPYLRAAGVETLDALVISHQDLDHAGGALSIAQTVPISALWSSLPLDHPIVKRVSGRGTTLRCAAGQMWQWDGVIFTVLFPPTTQYRDAGVKTNDLSCVLRVDSIHGSLLLTGDIEAVSERTLVANNARALRADALIVPHHGSRTSSTVDFVKAVAPQVAVFTAGYRNRFGHPRPDVVARYEREGARILRSDADGAITLRFDGAHRLDAFGERHVRRRYWYDGARH